MIQHTLPADIERTSMQIIAEELAQQNLVPAPECEVVVRRVIHATADFDYAHTLRFTPGAVRCGVEALKQGTPIVTDSNMALAGISKPSLAALGCTAQCFMADPEVAKEAKQEGTTRAVASMRRAAEICPNGIFCGGQRPDGAAGDVRSHGTACPASGTGRCCAGGVCQRGGEQRKDLLRVQGT